MEDLIRALRELDPEHHPQMERIVHSALQCFTDDASHGLWLFTTDDVEAIAVLSVNCGELEAAQLLTAVDAQMHYRLMSEAPPKERMN